MRKVLHAFVTGLVFFFSASVSAQAPDWSWAKSTGGTTQDLARGIAAHASGNVYVTGSYDTQAVFGTTTLSTAMSGVLGMYLVKYDAAGNVVWAQGNLNGSKDTEGMAVATDTAGNVYVTGTFRSSSAKFGTLTLSNSAPGFANVFLVKYDPSGNVTWARGFGGVMEELPNSLAVDAGGNAYVAGNFSSTSLVVGSSTLTNAGGTDLFVAKYDAAGNAAWAVSMGNSSNESAMAVKSDATGNVYVAGNFSGSSLAVGAATLTNSGTGSADLFMMKLNAAGNVLWAESAAGSSGSESPLAVDVDPSGNTYITGYFYSSTLQIGATALVKKGNSDLFIMKFDPTGSLAWARNEGAAGQDARGKGIALDAAGGIYLTGEFNGTGMSFDTLYLPSANTTWSADDDVFVVKYNSSGSGLWARNAGGGNTEMAAGIVATATNVCYTAGTFYGSAAFGSLTVSSGSQNFDMFVARLYAVPVVTGLHEQNASFFLSCSPNPASAALTIRCSEEIRTVTCTDYCGRELGVRFSNHTVDVSSLAAGCYFLTVSTSSGKTATRKFIRE